MSTFETCRVCQGRLIPVPGHPPRIHPMCAPVEESWISKAEWRVMEEQLIVLELLPAVGVVVVCGGREYADTVQVERTLELLNPEAILRHGGATGADALAGHVWKRMGGTVEVFEADWDGKCTLNCPRGHRKQRARGGTYCPAAGPRRNRRMASAEPRPEAGLAFPGGAGTKDMVAVLRAVRIPVRLVPERIIAPKRALPTKPKPGRRAA